MSVNTNRTRNVERVFDVIRPAVTDKSVLHLGCVAHDARKIDGSAVWMHELLDDAADSCLGVDVLDEGVQEMRDSGYEAICADAQNLSLDRTFDTIVAGELIEHLVELEGFVDSLLSHLNDKDSAQIVITTPNAMALHWTVLRALKIDFINEEHTCWFDETTIDQLFSRYDASVESVTYVGDCEFVVTDPLYSIGRVSEMILPDRIGKSTLVAFISPDVR